MTQKETATITHRVSARAWTPHRQPWHNRRQRLRQRHRKGNQSPSAHITPAAVIPIAAAEITATPGRVRARSSHRDRGRNIPNPRIRMHNIRRARERVPAITTNPAMQAANAAATAA